MRRKSILIITLLILISVALAAFALQPSAADLLTRSIETMQTVTDGHAVVEFAVTTPQQSGSGTVEVWGMLDAGPNGEPAFRVDVLETSLEVGAVGRLPFATAVADGTTFWLYNSDENKVLTGTYEEAAVMLMERYAGHDFQGQMPHEFNGEFDPAAGEHPQTAAEAVEKLLEYFDAERVGLTSEDVAGVGAYQVRLIPIPEQMPEEVRAVGGLINVWIAAESQAPLAAEYTGGNMGSGRVEATTLEFNQGIDPAVFTFDIPAGAEVVTLNELEAAMAAKMAEIDAAAVEFEALTPTDLPADARLVETTAVRGTAVQRYSLPGGSSFTVAQGPAGFDYAPEGLESAVTVRGVAGLLYSDEAGGRTLLTWTEGEMSFWIGGDLTGDQALAAAESLQ
jgi:outer membrane lipoprotein-sorting protein